MRCYLGTALAISTGLITTYGVVWALRDWYNRRRKNIEGLRSELEKILCYGRDNVVVSVIETVDDWKKVEQIFIKSAVRFGIVGLDVEWVGKGKLALMQLAVPTGQCLLIRLNRLMEIPSELRQLLGGHEILKLGVGIRDDCAKLLTDYDTICHSWIDIRHLVRSKSPQCKKFGMAGIAQELLGITLDKDWKIRASDWEEGENKQGQLSQRQIEYAANDALIAVSITLQLAINDMEYQRWFWKSSPEISLEEVIVMIKDTCLCYVERDIKYKPIKASKESTPSRKDRSRSYPRKIDPAKERHRNGIRKRPLYHNVRLEAPDGQQLCVTDVRKANWYVLKGLGKYVDENESTVRLVFEPAGRPEGPAGDYYLTEKCNRCVVCGKDESYLRKYIVPHEYRKFFPEIMRDHQSHDVLLMCVSCHQNNNLHDLGIY